MEEKRKFKVGDRVRCIVAVDGNERVLNATGTVKGLRDYDALVEFDKAVNGHNGGYTYKGVCKAFHGWYCKYKSLELLNNETIVIYRKDNEVIALDKSTGKKAVAKCSPADEFDFMTGAKLAFERLTRNVTFRLLCVRDLDLFGIKGDVFEFVDGVTTWRGGGKSNKYESFKEFEGRMGRYANNFIELKEGDDPAEILKKYDKAIKVGDTVKVVSDKQRYTTYSTFFKENNLDVDVASRYVYDDNDRFSGNYKVLFIGKHSNTNKKLAVIESTSFIKRVYLFNLDALERV